MTPEARLMSGIILITVPSIQYGGYFLLTSLMNKSSGYMDNPLRQNFFRAGHAHAGVIVTSPSSVRCCRCSSPSDVLALVRPHRCAARRNTHISGLLLFGASPGPNSSQRSGLPDLRWSSCSCRGSRFARHWLDQSRIVRCT